MRAKEESRTRDINALKHALDRLFAEYCVVMNRLNYLESRVTDLEKKRGIKGWFDG